MAAPSVSGIDLTRINSFATTTGITATPTIGTNGMAVSVTANVLRIRYTANPANQVGVVRIPVSPALDATNTCFTFRIEIGNYTTSVKVRFLDAGGNSKTFTIVSNAQRNLVFNVSLDLSMTGSGVTTSGTLDLTTISNVEIDVISATAPTQDLFFSRIAVVSNLTLAGGEVVNPAKISNFEAYLNATLPTGIGGFSVAGDAGLGSKMYSLAGSAIEVIYKLRIAADIFNNGNEGAVFLFPNSNQFGSITTATTSTTRFLKSSLRTVEFALTQAQTISNLQASSSNFVNLSTPTITFNSLVLNNMLSVSMGSGILANSTISNPSGVVSGGAAFNSVLFSGSTAAYAYEWNGVATFSSSEFVGNTAHYINVEGANFTSGATLNLSTVTFGTPGTKKIRVNAAGKTLNIQTSGNLSLSDVTVVAGTVNIVAPTITVSITGLIATTRLKIYNAGTQTLIDGVSSSGTSFSWTTGVVGQLYDIYYVLPGYIPGVIRGYQYPATNAALSIEMLVDAAYLSTGGAFDLDTASGANLGTTSDVYINISSPAAVRVQMATGNGLSLATGITWQQLYSFIIESRYASDTYMPYNGIVTAVSVTAGEFEMRRGAELANSTSENLMRDGGVAYVTTAGATAAQYLNVTGLGELETPASTTGYYAQDAATNASTTNFVNPGQPNQMIKIFGDATHGNFDRRSFLAVFARRIGEAGTRYELLASQGLTTLRPQKYSVLLSTATDLLITITADTQVDANADGTPDVAPYTGMSITWQDVSAFYASWANATIYPAKSVVGSGGRWWYTVAGGTSSGAGVANDTGVTWVAYAGERQIDGVYRCFQVITDLNGASYEFIRNYHNWALRQAVDIDAGVGNRTGKVVGRLSTTRGSQVVMGTGGYVDDFEVADQLNVVPVDVFGVEWEFPPPPNQIAISGLPVVSGTILAVQNLTTNAITYPALVGGGCTIELDPAVNYLFAADAPGYLRQAVTLPGNTPTFVFGLEDFRALYESGVSRASDIAFNYGTLAVTIGDGTAALSFADVFRTIEDYLATESGVLFPNPPIPVVVDVGGGNGRNYLFFPYDELNDQVNPVVIKPDPTNTTDPTLTNFVIVLEDADAPLFDIFDFTGAGGRTIRFQTEAVAATVNVSGGLSTEDRAVINAIAVDTSGTVEGLAEIKGAGFTADDSLTELGHTVTKVMRRRS